MTTEIIPEGERLLRELPRIVTGQVIDTDEFHRWLNRFLLLSAAEQEAIMNSAEFARFKATLKDKRDTTSS